MAPELHGMILDAERTSQISEAVVKCNAGESFQDSVEKLFKEGMVSEETRSRFVASKSA
jgi:hypothetical protein